MKARILERWDMELPAPVEGHPWFLDWVLRSPRGASTHLTAGWLALQSIADLDIDSVREYFGGMGAQALMAESIWHPDEHTVLEISPEAVRHITRLLAPDVVARVGDSYDSRYTKPADLQLLDFGDLTVHKAFAQGRHHDLLDRIFLLEPKAVVLTDIAARYLHLHRPHYDRWLGTGASATYESYLSAFSRKIEEVWGYRLVKGFSDRWSTVLSFVPVTEENDYLFPPGEINPTPESPIGLVLS